jgi:GH35 family endo-1,4-beta-xylanase
MIMTRYLALALMLALTASASADLPEPEAVVISPERMLAQELLVGQGCVASGERVDVQGQPFDKAMRITVERDRGEFWAIQWLASTRTTIADKDALWLELYARCVEPARDGRAYVTVYFQRNGPPWDKAITQMRPVGKQWTRIAIPFKSHDAFAAGKAAVGFGFGHGSQVVEIAAPRLLNYGKKVAVTDLPRTRVTYVGRAPDAPWRKAAAERIDRHRKSDLVVQVVGPDGKPVADAAVHVRQQRHAFRFGSTISVRAFFKDGADQKWYRAKIPELFNHVSVENALKWPPWAGKWGDRFHRDKTLAMLRWVNEHDIRVHGHVLVWPSWKHVPRNLRTLANKPDALATKVRERIIDTVSATRGLLDEWDVVNEPFSNHDLMDVLGNEAMVEWFKLARKTDPDARLYINDYGILTAGGRIDTAHHKHYEKTIRFLLDKGAPLEGIGLQSHFGQITPPARVVEILDHYAKFALPMQITEFDIDTTDEQIQADYTRDFMTAVFSHPKVNGFVMWGFWEGRHWRPHAAMYRKDWSIKPNGLAYRQLVFKQWWTDARGATDKHGAFTIRAFLGTHKIAVEADRKRAEATVDLSADGRQVTVQLR